MEPKIAFACAVVSLLMAACSGSGRDAPGTGAVANVPGLATSAHAPRVLDAMAQELGVRLYRDYRAGRTQSIHATEATHPVSNSAASFAGPNQNSCHLYQDEDTRVDTTAPANARFVGCSVRWYSAQAGSTRDQVSDYRHAFVLVPDAEGGFALHSRARQIVDDCRPHCGRQLGSHAMPMVD